MGFKISDYDSLKKNYSAAILRLNGNHKVDSQNELPALRRMQVEFLDKIRDELDKSKTYPEKKSLIFSGAMFIVRNTISAEYRISSPLNSNLYNHLAKLLGIEDNTPLTPNEVYKLTHPALNFIKQLTFIDGEIEKGIKEKHAFLGIEEQFNVIWKVCSGLVKSASDEIVNKGFVKQKQNEVEHGKESKDAEKESVQDAFKDQSNSVRRPVVGSFFNSSSSPNHAPDCPNRFQNNH